MVFHDQSNEIASNISLLNSKIRNLGLPDHTIHTAPLIRNEKLYNGMPLLERKRIFNAIYHFVRMSKISYHSIIVKKKHCIDDVDLISKLTKRLSEFLIENNKELIKNNYVICYYDYGQRELSHIIASVFSAVLDNVKFKKVSPADYKLFQAADFLCTMEWLSAKAKGKILSKSELLFFGSSKELSKTYLRTVHKKRIA